MPDIFNGVFHCRRLRIPPLRGRPAPFRLLMGATSPTLLLGILGGRCKRGGQHGLHFLERVVDPIPSSLLRKLVRGPLRRQRIPELGIVGHPRNMLPGDDVLVVGPRGQDQCLGLRIHPPWLRGQ